MNKTDLERRGRALKLLCQCMNSRDAWNVEHAIYVSMAKSVFPDYEAKVRQIAWNVYASPTLLKQHDVHTLVLLDDTELARGTEIEAWYVKRHQDALRQHDLLHFRGESGALKCNRCHSRNVQVDQKQTRSADEGMTVFCTCSTCGMRWKM